MAGQWRGVASIVLKAISNVMKADMAASMAANGVKMTMA